MTPKYAGATLKVYLRCVLCSAGISAALAAAGTGFAVHHFAPASDIAAAQDPVWAEVKYLVLDLQMGMIYLATVGLLLWLLVLLLSWKTQALSTSLPKRVLASILGIVIVCIAARVMVKNTPTFVESIRFTQYPATEKPDQITLTWGGDPATSQSIQWRTALDSTGTILRFREQGAHEWTAEEALTEMLEATNMANDLVVERHTVTMEGLMAGTDYEYGIGDGGYWSETRSFTTAPSRPEAFSFMYLGDSQKGLLEFGRLLESGFQAHSDISFMVHAGDLVNRGCDRSDWDQFFYASRNVFDRVSFMPTIGNHDDCSGSNPRLYRMFFDLPENGPPASLTEQAYHFTYSNALFVVLNSNHSIAEQGPWLDKVLGESDAQWKFLIWHHPAYALRADRDNAHLRKTWTPIADKHGVDIVFQGHDHSYARSKPIHDGRVADDTDRGTIYLLSVSGTKFYEQDTSPLFDIGIENTSTYQIIRIDGGRLRYEAFDAANMLVDEFELFKG